MHQTQPARRVRRTESSVLDQGIAIAGELRVRLFGLNLLPIQVKLLISSKDLASQLGLDWWNDEKVRRSIKGRVKGRADRPQRNGRRGAQG